MKTIFEPLFWKREKGKENVRKANKTWETQMKSKLNDHLKSITLSGDLSTTMQCRFSFHREWWFCVRIVLFEWHFNLRRELGQKVESFLSLKSEQKVSNGVLRHPKEGSNSAMPEIRRSRSTPRGKFMILPWGTPLKRQRVWIHLFLFIYFFSSFCTVSVYIGVLSSWLSTEIESMVKSLEVIISDVSSSPVLCNDSICIWSEYYVIKL